MIIGITGYPASGKSTLSGILGEYGYFIINSDSVGHLVLEDKREELVKEFGKKILTNGIIDRRKLSDVVFISEALIAKLESIVTPNIIDKIDEFIGQNENIIIEAALIFETDLHKKCDEIWFVNAPFEIRLKRAESRGWDANEMWSRQKRMLSMAEVTKRVDRIINNFDGVNYAK